MPWKILNALTVHNIFLLSGENIDHTHMKYTPVDNFIFLYSNTIGYCNQLISAFQTLSSTNIFCDACLMIF